MSIYYDEASGAYRWQFKANIDGERHRLSRLLPRGWSETQARRYDEQETARTYARLSTGKRVTNVPLIDQAVALYLTERIPKQRDGKNAAHNLAHLLPHFKGKGLDQLGKIAREYAKAADLSPATIRQRLATLRSAASHALKHHDIGTADWIAAMPMPSVSNARHHYLERADVLRLARACRHRPTRALVLMTFATGSRPGELHRAKVVDGYLEMHDKPGHTIRKPVHRKVRQYMHHWPMQYSYSVLSTHFRHARRRLGMDHLHLHDIRHSTASALISAGVPLSQVGAVLDHATAQATKRYAHLYPEVKEAALENLWQKRPQKAKAR